jgi:uncharacterized membrane protein YbaN (DUF454 family)
MNMKQHVKRIIVLTLGVTFVLLGIAGLFLPFLQGLLFLVVGLLLLSTVSPRLRAWVESHTRRWPKFHGWVEKADTYIRRILGE